MSFIKYPNPKQFKKELDSGKLENTYLFMGEEAGEKNKFIDSILNLTFQDNETRKNSVARFHIENDEIFDAADFALSSSIFYSNRVCIMYNIDAMQSNKKNNILINEIIENRPDSTRLIMTTSANRPPSFMTSELSKKIKIIQFWRYFDQDIYHYITMNLNKLNLKINSDAIELFIELTGKDIKKIDDALELIACNAESKVIEKNIIKNLISDVKDISIFEFIDSLFRKKKNSLNLLKKLIDNGTPNLLILNMILRQAETLEKYYYYINSGSPVEDAMKKCGVINKKNKANLWEYIKIFPSEKLKKVFLLIAKTDLQIKSISYTKEFLSNPILNLVSDILFDHYSTFRTRSSS